MSELRYWVWLSMAEGLTDVGKSILYNSFASPRDVYFAAESDYRALGGLTSRDLKALSYKRLDKADKVLEDCARLGIRVITRQDAAYPARLKNIFDPPAVLYVRGNLTAADEDAAISVVGTRRCTAYGIKTARRVGAELAASGCTVVTGLAAGIDSAAAQGALSVGGKVIGVLGCGPDVVYPADNAGLYEDVMGKGLLISEFVPGTRPDSWRFPVRNRIMSGLSLGVCVVEAPIRSGALITAHRALDQGRDVFVIPGNVDSKQSEGCLKLLQEGAQPVSGGYDIVREYISMFPDKIRIERVPSERERKQSEVRREPEPGPTGEPERKLMAPEDLGNDVSEGEKAVFAVMGKDPMLADEITELAGLPPEKVMAALTMLQIGGYVDQAEGQRFIRASK